MKIIRKLFLILLLIILIVLTLFVGLGFVNYVKATNEVSIREKVEEIKNKKSYVTYDEISEELLQATVAIEDRRFYEHHGVEYRSMARALYQNVLAGQIRGGGSTITQQLAKNMYYTYQPVSYTHLYVPFVVVVKDGKAVSGHIGTVDGHDAHERKMTEKEMQELKKIYADMFSAVTK